MARFDSFDSDGNLTETFVVSEETLKADKEAVLKLRVGHDGTDAGKKAASRKPPGLEGYDYLCSAEGDPDAAVTNCVVHVFAKKGSYEKEKPSTLSTLASKMKAPESSVAGKKNA